MLKKFEATADGGRLATALRVAALLCCLMLVAVLVDLEPIFEHLRAVNWSTLALMIGLQMIIIVVSSWRFSIIAQASGANFKIVEASKLTFGSTLANMLLPLSLAGDVGRIWLVRQFGLSLKAAVSVGIFDRIIGLLSLSMIVLFGALADNSIRTLFGSTLVLLAMAGILLIVLAYWLRFGAPDALSKYFAPQFRSVAATTMVLSTAAHLGSVAVAYLFFLDQEISISITQLLILFPAVLLAGSLPISIGGWGTRELTAAGVFAIIGIVAPTAIAMAFLFGLTQVVAAGLGTAYFALRNTGAVSENE